METHINQFIHFAVALGAIIAVILMNRELNKE